MEPRDLHYFAVIADHGNLGRAAEAIGISQPALSKTLRRLEKSTGTKIVSRTPTGVELTAMGRVLLTHARRMQLALDDMLKEVADLNGGRSGSIRIGANFDAAELLLPSSFAILMKYAPDVVAKVVAGTNEDLVPALHNGDLDLVVTGIPASGEDDVVQELLCEDEFVVCAAATHPLARRKRVTMADLATERWAMTSGNVLSWQHVRRAFADGGLPPPRVAMEANFRLITLNAVAQSGLLGFIPEHDLKQTARRPGLVKLPVRELAWTRRLGVRYRKSAYLSPAARKFIGILKTEALRLRAG